jgi:hypothetical protein
LLKKQQFIDKVVSLMSTLTPKDHLTKDGIQRGLFLENYFSHDLFPILQEGAYEC